MRIQVGDLVLVRTAAGTTARMRAVSKPGRGRDFPVVWVCTEQEYERVRAGQDVEGIPWPLDAVIEQVASVDAAERPRAVP